jgi:hypothetical protein
MTYANINLCHDLDLDDYHQVNAVLGPVADGLLFEAAGQNDQGLYVLSLWETKAQHDRFIGERLIPAMSAAGVNPGAMTITELDVDVVFTADTAALT